MNIGFIGCVASSFALLEKLLHAKIKNTKVVAVITKNSSSVNSDFMDISVLCKEDGIPFHYEESDKKSESIAFMKKYNPDILYCFGWSQLLGKEMLSLAPRGVIGFHPAPLPIGRGRHPLVWALALGLKETASTFFKMDKGADSGDILNQRFVCINEQDNAGILYENILQTAKDQIIEFTVDLMQGKAKFEPQDESRANYWRKRIQRDGIIDWRMDANEIRNLVRALSMPYPGAEFILHGQRFIVWNATVNNQKVNKYVEPGCILSVENNDILVKCAGESSLWIHDLKIVPPLQAGDYL